MFGQNGFCHNRAHTSGLDQQENRRDEMDNEHNQIAHEPMVQQPENHGIPPNVEFARHRLTIGGNKFMVRVS